MKTSKGTNATSLRSPSQNSSNPPVPRGCTSGSGMGFRNPDSVRRWGVRRPAGNSPLPERVPTDRRIQRADVHPLAGHPGREPREYPEDCSAGWPRQEERPRGVDHARSSRCHQIRGQRPGEEPVFFSLPDWRRVLSSSSSQTEPEGCSQSGETGSLVISSVPSQSFIPTQTAESGVLATDGFDAVAYRQPPGFESSIRTRTRVYSDGIRHW